MLVYRVEHLPQALAEAMLQEALWEAFSLLAPQADYVGQGDLVNLVSRGIRSEKQCSGTCLASLKIRVTKPQAEMPFL